METKRLNDVPGLMHLWQVDNLLIAGQPSEESFAKFSEMGIKKVFNLRSINEVDFSFEVDACQKFGFEYTQIPIVSDGELIPQACEELSSLVNADEVILIHCGSANRVAAWLMTYLSTRRNIKFDDAVDIATNSGLSNPAFIEQARKIVEG